LCSHRIKAIYLSGFSLCVQVPILKQYNKCVSLQTTAHIINDFSVNVLTF